MNMRIPGRASLSLLILASLVSCAATQAATTVKQASSREADRADVLRSVPNADETWAARHIPGWKTLSNLIPEPTEARRDWDRHLNKRSNPWGSRESGD